MLTFETSTELLLKQLIQLGHGLGILLILFGFLIYFIGGIIVSALDNVNANLTVLGTNAGLIAANVAALKTGQTGGATEVQVQAIADALKTINNAAIVGTDGTTPIP